MLHNTGIVQKSHIRDKGHIAFNLNLELASMVLHIQSQSRKRSDSFLAGQAILYLKIWRLHESHIGQITCVMATKI